MRIRYPVAHDLKEALEKPLGYGTSEAAIRRRAGLRVESLFTVKLSPKKYKRRQNAQKAFAKALDEGWGELAQDLDDNWRVWVSFLKILPTPKEAPLSDLDKAVLAARQDAAMGPRRAIAQQPVDFGLFAKFSIDKPASDFEIPDPARPGHSIADE